MKIDKFLILVILFILILAFGTYWQFKGFRESISKIEFPKFEMPETKPFSSGEKKYLEFISPDGKLKLKYSSDWTNVGTESLENLNREMLKEGAKVLFFGHKVKLEKAAFASLFIQEINLEEKKIEEIIEEMKESIEKNGGEMEITQLKIGEKETYFEVEYKRKEGTIFNSKEKILISGEKAYSISILALDSFWPEFKDEADEILNSAQIVP
jgi:hypothetical protein